MFLMGATIQSNELLNIHRYFIYSWWPWKEV